MDEINIIIPVFNTLGSLKQSAPDLISFIKGKSNHSITVTVVDDGSSNPVEIKEFCNENNFQLIPIKKNKGKGNAIKTAILQSKSDYCIFTDADIPFTFQSLDLMIASLINEKHIFVIGDRTLKDSKYFVEINKKRKFISAIFTFIVNTFITNGIKDTQCGLKGFNLQSTKNLFNLTRANRFTFDVELIHIATINKTPIQRIPVTIKEQEGSSSVRLFTDSFIMLIDLIKIKTRSLTGKYKLIRHESP